METDLPGHEFATTLLRDLIRIDTSNPPGNELPACERVAAALAEAGIEPRIHVAAPGRASVTARLRGDGRLPPLMLSAHLDVVPADPAGWTHPPFAAETADGCIWGRGAIDMKQMAAQSVTALLRLKAKGLRLRRDVLLSCVADEETGSALGAHWLVDNAPDEVRAGVVLGEIGGMSMRIAGRRLYPVQVAEKGLAWLRLRARGSAGHGSMPLRPSAVGTLARAVERLAAKPLPTHLTPVTRAFASEILGALGGAARLAGPLVMGEARLAGLLRLAGDAPIARTLGAMLANTVSPTVLRAGDAVNVIPSEATAELDGRTLPGQGTADLLREVRAVAGGGIDIEVIREAPPVEAPLDHPILGTIREVLGERDPEGTMVPTLTPGFTDAKAWSRLGAACYGFSPVRFPDDFPTPYAAMFHNVDERIPIEGFHWGVDALAEVVERWATKEAER